MSIRSAQSITKMFTTRVFSTGVATNADSLPTGTLYVNGTADAATVTVTNVTTGVYKAQVTLPTLAIGDVVDLRINATVSTIADNAIIWQDTKDIELTSGGVAKADLETIKTQAVTCSGGVTVPAATLASTTNITAGTTSASNTNAIADAILNRGVSNVENTADRHSLAAAVLLATNASHDGVSMIAKKPSDDSTFNTYTLVVTGDHITGVS